MLYRLGELLWLFHWSEKQSNPAGASSVPSNDGQSQFWCYQKPKSVDNCPADHQSQGSCFSPPDRHFLWQTRFCSEDVQKSAVPWPRKERICDIWSASSKPHPNSVASPKPPASPAQLMWTQEGSPSTAWHQPSNACVVITRTRERRNCLKRALPWLKNT